MVEIRIIRRNRRAKSNRSQTRTKSCCQKVGPLAKWIEPLLSTSRTYFQQANVGNWPYLVHITDPDVPFSATWIPTGRHDECPVCGTDRTPPESLVAAGRQLDLSEAPVRTNANPEFPEGEQWDRLEVELTQLLEDGAPDAIEVDDASAVKVLR